MFVERKSCTRVTVGCDIDVPCYMNPSACSYILSVSYNISLDVPSHIPT